MFRLKVKLLTLISNIIFFINFFYQKAKFIPYMFGVNTRLYGLNVFKKWFLKFSLTKFFVYYFRLSVCNLTTCENIAFFLVSLLHKVYVFIFISFFNYFKAYNFFKYDNSFIWPHFYQTYKGWGLWLNHFVSYSFKQELPLKDLKILIYMRLFKIYSRMRTQYFYLTILFCIVHTSLRRRRET